MLRVKTTLAPSKIHGLGLFADEPIKCGQIVWEFDPRFDLKIDRVMIRGMADENLDHILRHCYINPENPGVFVVCFDDARFINFAQKPSLALATLWVRDGETGLIAARDIAVWDELTVGPETDADYARKMKILTNR